MDVATPEKKKIHQGRNTKRWREIMGITQTEVGDFLEITQQAVSKLEDKEEIEPQTLAKISEKINIPVDVLKNKEPQEQMGYNVNNDIHDLHDQASVSGNSCSATHEINYTYFNCVFNPLEEVKALYERLLEAEREKNKTK